MTGKAYNYMIIQDKKTVLGKCLGGAAVLLALVALGCSGGGEKNTDGKTEQKSVVQETAVQETVVPSAVATTPSVTTMPEAKQTQPAKQLSPSLGMTPEEFRLRFNKTSELEKSKLRIKKLKIESGSDHNSFKNIFNENLYLSGEVNREDGLLAEINFAGVLNGSLSTTVDLNVSFGTIITAFSPKLSPDERDAVLYALGITNKNADVYSLDKKVTRNGITYWVKSSRAAGIRFGARSAKG
jgi:hypothetical protein